MARATRPYDHFCMLARALERVGDRWTLLIVRDLLGGPRRFTDLMARLGGITPKTLTQRLRDLAEDGIVEVDRSPGRREVWYRLTPAGGELGPAVDALSLWGLRHARRPPLPREAVHPEHLLTALRMVLSRSTLPPRPVAWQFRFTREGSYVLRFDGRTWRLEADADDTEADVVVNTTTDAWLRFLGTPPSERDVHQTGIQVQGTAEAIDRFTSLVARFPDGADDEEPRPTVTPVT